MTSTRIHIIDGMPLFYACTYNHVKDNIQPSLDYLRACVFNYLMEIEKTLPAANKTVIVIDGQDNWRSHYFPEYKAKRKADRKKSEFDWKAFHKTVDELIEELKDYYPAIVTRTNVCEGDDVIAVLTEALSPKAEIIIVASDKDLIQLHKLKGVKQFDMRKMEYITEESRDLSFVEHVLKGDYADGIPNILSDNDTYTNPQKKTVRFKKVDYEKWKGFSDIDLLEEEISNNRPELLESWNRNRTLIDFSRIPDDVREKIGKDFREAIKHEKKAFDAWIKEHGLEYVAREQKQEFYLNSSTGKTSFDDMIPEHLRKE